MKSFSYVISLIFFLISFQGSQIKTLISGQLNLGLVAGADDEDVGESGGELLAGRVPDVHDVEPASVAHSVRHDPDAPDIVTSRDIGDVA